MWQYSADEWLNTDTPVGKGGQGYVVTLKMHW